MELHEDYPTVTELGEARQAVLSAYPELADSSFSLLAAGWHATAFDCDNRLIFKFPRNAEGERALLKEAGLLECIRPAVTLPVPNLVIHAGPPLFSRHDKLQGETLLADDYAKLPDARREQLADDLGQFYAELHALDAELMRSAGAVPVEAWASFDWILPRVVRVLPADLHSFAERTLEAWPDLSPDPHGTTFGFFDGHGWNMAFDHEEGRLRGIFDFGDSGFGPVHQEFIYSNFISRDLTLRIIARYEALTGRTIDRERVMLLTGVHRLWELAQAVEKGEHVPLMLRHVAEWARG